MRNRLIPLLCVLILALVPFVQLMASDSDNGLIVEVQLGMSEAAILERYPNNRVSIDGTEMTFEGRYGDFRLGEQEHHNGLSMFKLKPSNLESRDECKSFFNTFKPQLTGLHGDPASESANEESALGAWQAAWQAPGLSIRLEAIWYEEQTTCVAEIFVRPTNIERL